MTSISKLARSSAGVGALIWSICLFFHTGDSIETELIPKVFLLAVFVIVPLGLSLTATPNRLGSHSSIYVLAVVAQPVGAVAALVSFFIEPGITAALLAAIDQAMYVAAYATHSRLTNTYMNIAFPLPGGNLSSILHLDVSTSGERTGGVVLSTLGDAQAGGDQGVYYANQVIPVRLPINEVITVWPAKSLIGGGVNDKRLPVLLAKHEMWIFGVNFLNLDYEIYERSTTQLQ